MICLNINDKTRASADGREKSKQMKMTQLALCDAPLAIGQRW